MLGNPLGAHFRKRIRPRVYTIALYVVGAFILVQLIALGSVFWLRRAAVKIDVAGPMLKQAAVNAAANGADATLFSKNLTGHPYAESKGARILKLNDEAHECISKGYFFQAEDLLQQASALDPEDLNTLVNFALLEEGRRNSAKALEYWKRVVRLGEGANETTRLANAKIKTLEAKLQGEGAMTMVSRGGIITLGKAVTIEQVFSFPTIIPDNSAEVQFDFIISSSLPLLEPGKLRVQVFIYEQWPNGDLAPAKIRAYFINPRPTWRDQNTETLRALYTRSEQGGARYCGYLIRLVYDGVLQDEKAQPASLLGLFPYQTPQ
ncbi:MAG: hypothetical protein V1746_06430 [bacterium]